MSSSGSVLPGMANSQGHKPPSLLSEAIDALYSGKGVAQLHLHDRPEGEGQGRLQAGHVSNAEMDSQAANGVAAATAGYRNTPPMRPSGSSSSPDTPSPHTLQPKLQQHGSPTRRAAGSEQQLRNELVQHIKTQANRPPDPLVEQTLQDQRALLRPQASYGPNAAQRHAATARRVSAPGTSLLVVVNAEVANLGVRAVASQCLPVAAKAVKALMK